ADVYAAMTSLTGKFELEYEGEMRGPEQVAAELIRAAIGTVFQHYFADADLQQIVQFFELGGTLKLAQDSKSKELLKELQKVQGLIESLAPLGLKPKADPARLVAGCEFVLEGLYAHRKISRDEQRGLFAPEPPPEPSPHERPPRQRRSYQ
ncbi:MAG: magnesium chelatase, partial [Terriglobia bacterium]